MYRTRKEQRKACPSGYMLCPKYGTCRPRKEVLAEGMGRMPYTLDFEGGNPGGHSLFEHGYEWTQDVAPKSEWQQKEWVFRRGGRINKNNRSVSNVPGGGREPDPCQSHITNQDPYGYCVCMTNFYDPNYGLPDQNGGQECCPFAGCNPATVDQESWYQNCNCYRTSDCPGGAPPGCCYQYQCFSCGFAESGDPLWFLPDDVYEMCYGYGGVFATCSMQGLLSCPWNSDFPGECVVALSDCMIPDEENRDIIEQTDKIGGRRGGPVRNIQRKAFRRGGRTRRRK